MDKVKSLAFGPRIWQLAIHDQRTENLRAFFVKGESERINNLPANLDGSKRRVPFSGRTQRWQSATLIQWLDLDWGASVNGNTRVS